MKRFRYLLFAILFCSFAVLNLPAREDAEDDAARTVIREYFDAYGKHDIPALEKSLSKSFSIGSVTRDKYLAAVKKDSEKLAPTTYRHTIHSIRKEGKGVVVVRVEYKGTLRPKNGKGESTDEGLIAIQVERDGTSWKITQIVEAHIDVFLQVQKARTRVEKLAILKKETDEFLTLEFIGNLTKLHSLWINQGKFEIAEGLLSLMELAVEAIKDEKDRELWKVMCLLDRGSNEYHQAKYAKAVSTYEAACAIALKNDWHNIVVSAQCNLLEVYNQIGDPLNAIKVGEAARKKLATFAPIARALTEAGLLGNLGKVYIDLGNYTKAKECLDESLRLAEKQGHDEFARTARVNLALIHQQQGRYDLAISAYKTIIAELNKAGLTRQEGQLMNNLALALAEQRRVGEALRVYEEARKLSVSAKDTRAEATLLFNLALLHYRLDNREDSVRYLEQSRSLYKAVANKAGIARCQRMLGLLEFEAGNKEAAERLFNECLKEANASGNLNEMAQLSSLIGITYYQDKLWDKASEAIQTSMKLYMDMGDRHRELLSRQMWVWILALTDDKRFDAEYDKLRRDAIRLDDQAAILNTRCISARGAMIAKMWKTAKVEVDAALKIYEQRLELIEDPHLQTSYASLGNFTGLYLIDAAAQHALGDSSGAFNAIERAKSRSLARLLNRSQIPIHKGLTVPEQQTEAKLREQVVAASRILASGRKLNNEPGKLEQTEQELAEAVAKYEEQKRKMFLAHPELRAHRGELPTVDLNALQKNVFQRAPDTAIISYLAAYGRLLIAVVTRGEKADGPAQVTLTTVEVDEKELTDAADDFLSACQNHRAGRPISDKLHQWLIDPIAKQIADKKHLVIIPCHPLLAISFAALAPDKQSPYLIEKYAISYAPSVGALTEMQARRNRIQGVGRADRLQLLAVGGVKFTDDLKELPASGPEAEAIAKLFGTRSRVLTGKDATRTEVVKAMPQARFIHVATHGLVNPPRPLFSALALTQVDENDDGRLYAHDIMNLELTAEMVVLSACETGRGRDFRGEGTVGLSWAFFVAGAPAVVVSQWPVADDKAAELVVAFYQRVRERKDVSNAESLRQACLSLLNNRETRHPRFWAPFVLVGDWRN